MRLAIFLTLFIFFLNIYANADVDMEILPGFDGYHKHNCWLPLRISLSGRAEGQIVSQIYVSDTDSTKTYSKPVQVFDMASNTQYLYIFPEAYRRNLSIGFLDDKGNELIQREAALKPVSQDEGLILVVSEDAGGLEFLANVNRTNYVSYVTTDLLPDNWKGFDSVDTMVLGKVSPDVFSDDQAQAIVDWVYNGGTLIISGGAYSQGLMGTFLERLLPVKINGSKILDSLDPLSQRYGHNISKSRTVAAWSELADDGMVIVSDDGLPLIAERRSGYGKTVFLAFDYMDPAIRGWEGKKGMWGEFLPEPMPHDFPEDRDVSRILLATDFKGPLSYKWAGLFLLLYVLCFLLLNYFILKRTGKSMLIWLAMPVIGIIFSIGALDFNYSLKGQGVIINDLSVVDLYQESGRARVTSYFGLFSPTNRDYGLNFPETVFIRNIKTRDSNSQQGRDYKLVEDEIFEMIISKARILEPVLLQGDSCLALKGKVTLKLDENSGGKVTSELPFDLTECYVFSEGHGTYIGDLEHDKTVDIKMSGDVPVTHSKMEGQKQRFFNSMRQKLSGSVTGRGLIGWADESALREFLGMRMDKEYKSVGTTLILVHI